MTALVKISREDLMPNDTNTLFERKMASLMRLVMDLALRRPYNFSSVTMTVAAYGRAQTLVFCDGGGCFSLFLKNDFLQSASLEEIISTVKRNITRKDRGQW